VPDVSFKYTAQRHARHHTGPCIEIPASSHAKPWRTDRSGHPTSLHLMLFRCTGRPWYYLLYTRIYRIYTFKHTQIHPKYTQDTRCTVLFKELLKSIPTGPRYGRICVKCSCASEKLAGNLREVHRITRTEVQNASFISSLLMGLVFSPTVQPLVRRLCDANQGIRGAVFLSYYQKNLRPVPCVIPNSTSSTTHLFFPKQLYLSYLVADDVYTSECPEVMQMVSTYNPKNETCVVVARQSIDDNKGGSFTCVVLTPCRASLCAEWCDVTSDINAASTQIWYTTTNADEHIGKHVKIVLDPMQLSAPATRYSKRYCMYKKCCLHIGLQPAVLCGNNHPEHTYCSMSCRDKDASTHTQDLCRPIKDQPSPAFFRQQAMKIDERFQADDGLLNKQQIRRKKKRYNKESNPSPILDVTTPIHIPCPPGGVPGIPYAATTVSSSGARVVFKANQLIDVLTQMKVSHS
jgi:hypothetical protein